MEISFSKAALLIILSQHYTYTVLPFDTWMEIQHGWLWADLFKYIEMSLTPSFSFILLFLFLCCDLIKLNSQSDWSVSSLGFDAGYPWVQTANKFHFHCTPQNLVEATGIIRTQKLCLNEMDQKLRINALHSVVQSLFVRLVLLWAISAKSKRFLWNDLC